MYRVLLGLVGLLAASSLVAQVEGGGVEPVDLNLGLIGAWAGPFELGEEPAVAAPASARETASGDFTVAAQWNPPNGTAGDSKGRILSAGPGQGKAGWALSITSEAAIRFELFSGKGLGSQIMTGPPMDRRRPHLIAVVVKRDPRQPVSGVWIDGVEVSSVNVPPGNAVLASSALKIGGGLAKGTITGVRLYERALSRPEIIELAIASGQTSAPTLKPFGETFAPKDGEVFAVLGGSEAVAVMEDGTMEALLVMSFPDRRIGFRSLAWETDTVFRQDRPMNFGGLRQQLFRAGATAVILMFGRQECLERGEAGIDDFRQALKQMINQCMAHTPRIVLAAMPMFEKQEPPRPDLSVHNSTLAGYNAAIRQVATETGSLFAGITVGSDTNDTGPRTTDGLNLSLAGAREMGLQIASLAVGSRGSNLPPTTSEGAGLAALVRAKNRLWHEYWRPSNWAFLHGDRTAQPSSRDHLNPSVRWFPAELEQYRKLIADKEQQIWKLAGEVGGKLP